MGLLAAASPAKLTIETIVGGIDRTALTADRDVTIKGERPEGIVVETPRYRAYTEFLQRVAAAGGSIREIAGNDRIFVTVVSDAARRNPASAALFEGKARFLFSVPCRRRGTGAARTGVACRGPRRLHPRRAGARPDVRACLRLLKRGPRQPSSGPLRSRWRPGSAASRS